MVMPREVVVMLAGGILGEAEGTLTHTEIFRED
jgi:hypothetical protein